MTAKSSKRLEDLELGEKTVYRREMKDEYIDKFGDAIGNHHIIHMDPEWIDRQTPWGPKRVMHGLMTMSLVSWPISAYLERHNLVGCICYSQEKLIAPVRVGDTVTVELTYLGLVPDRPRLRFAVEARNQNQQLVMKGEVHEHVFL